MGFTQSTSDPCVYVGTGEKSFFIEVYVDDIILAGSCNKKIKEVKDALSLKFVIKDMGKLHYFLGMKILQDKESGNTWICQPAYSENLLRKFGMKGSKGSKPVSTRVDTSTKFVKATTDRQCVDQQCHQSQLEICCTYQLVQDQTTML